MEMKKEIAENFFELLKDKTIRHAFLCAIVKYSLATQIKQLRLSRQFTQTQLAVKLKTKASVISRWETAKCFPSTNTLLKLASIFDVGIVVRFVTYDRFLADMVFTPQGVFIRKSQDILDEAVKKFDAPGETGKGERYE